MLNESWKIQLSFFLLQNKILDFKSEIKEGSRNNISKKIPLHYEEVIWKLLI